MVSVVLVVPRDITRTWRRGGVVSAILPAAAVRALCQMTVRPAQFSAPNFTKAHAPKIAPLVLTMRLQLWSVKVRTGQDGFCG